MASPSTGGFVNSRVGGMVGHFQRPPCRDVAWNLVGRGGAYEAEQGDTGETPVAAFGHQM